MAVQILSANNDRCAILTEGLLLRAAASGSPP